VRTRAPLHFDYTASPPTATAVFLPPRWVVNERVAAGAPAHARALPPGTRFDLAVRLLLPEHPANLAVGLFQVVATLQRADGAPIAAASRPAALPYRSLPVRWARRAALGPLLAAGLVGEAAEVEVPLFAGFADTRAQPLAQLQVQLVGRAGGGPVPQVAAATAVLRLRLGPLAHALHRWPLSSALLCTGATVAALLAAALAAGLLVASGELLAPPPPPVLPAGLPSWEAPEGDVSDGEAAEEEEEGEGLGNGAETERETGDARAEVGLRRRVGL